MKLLKFWPTETDCLECITPEAENPSDAVFLAVHQEMRFVRRSFNTDQSEKKSQTQLLKEFLRDEPSGRVILPILGESGIGKSHLVRWLKIQLRQRDDRDKRHVILIPKSSSLKSVLGRILDGLDGPRYAEIRSQLKAAREQMDEIGAKERIRAELLTLITRKYESALERKEKALQAAGTISKQDQLWIGHGDPRALPSLISDPATAKLFMEGTPTRCGIISELSRHLTKDTSETHSPRRQFDKEDFLIPKELADEITDAGSSARKYLDKLLRTTSAKLLEEVVYLLNEIVDDAIAPLATPADTSLSNLFYDVRRQLLKEGRELVLLVEDFAVLAGVQRALLDAILREGQAGGKAEACVIRTALAVTDGYFFSANLETVQTRAVHGWWIESGESETEDGLVSQIGNFVASYVNAARIGAKKLEEHYRKLINIGKKKPNATDFITLDEDELGLLNSFGYSTDGYSLFPFNKSAIHTIADWRLRDQEGKLKFHPRTVINEIILPVVKNGRANYENSNFPPRDFLGYQETKISADLTRELSRKEDCEELRFQYLYLLEFWAKHPEKISDSAIEDGIYISFGLKPLDGSGSTATPQSLKPLPKAGENPGDAIEIGGQTIAISFLPVDRETQLLLQSIERIDDWRSGGVLGQGDANLIRGFINTHMLYSINWEAELLSPIKPLDSKYFNRIYLPRSKGNRVDPGKAFVLVATDDDFNKPMIANEIFSAIRAMFRYNRYKGWDYGQGDDDYIVLSNFIDFHIKDSAQWIKANYKYIEGSPVVSLVPALLFQARVLNIEVSHKSDDASHIDGIFSLPEEQKQRSDDPEWSIFLDEMKTNRKFLQKELLERVAAFQGTGKIPYAIDASQLLEVIQIFRKTWKVTEKFPSVLISDSDELKSIEKHINSLVRFGDSIIENRRMRIAEHSGLLVSELGREYNKFELLNDLVEVCSLSEQYGLRGEVPVSDVRKIAEKFKDSRAKEVSEQVEVIISSNDRGTQVSAIARLDIDTLALLVEFVKTCSRFLKERANKAQGQILAWTPEVVEMKKAVVVEILKDLEIAVTPYQKENA